MLLNLDWTFKATKIVESSVLFRNVYYSVEHFTWPLSGNILTDRKKVYLNKMHYSVPNSSAAVVIY